MKEENPTRLDQLMYKRLGPHLVHTFQGDIAVMRQSDHVAKRKLQDLRRQARTRRLT